MRASAVVNCQSALAWFLLRSSCQAAAPIEALTRQDTEFRLGHIQPTAMLGRIVPLEPLDEATCLGGWKGLIERCGLVGAEIVLHEHDLAGSAKVSVGQLLEHLRIVQCGVAVGYVDMPPSFQRCEQHEQVDRAITLILAVVSGWPSWFDRA